MVQEKKNVAKPEEKWSWHTKCTPVFYGCLCDLQFVTKHGDAGGAPSFSFSLSLSPLISSSLISQIWQELNEAAGESASLLLEVRITHRESEREKGGNTGKKEMA